MKAFQAFTIYRDMGPGRTLRAVSEQLFAGQAAKPTKGGRGNARSRSKTDRSSSSVEDWSSKWGWVERATAWDAELDRIARTEQVEAVKKMLERHAAAGVMAINRAIEKLASINGTQITVSEATRLLELGIKAERAARGEPDEVLGLSGPGGGPLQIDASPGLAAAISRIDKATAERSRGRVDEG